MDILLDDLTCKDLLFPFGEIRSVAHIRIGILTIFEKWERYFPGKILLASEEGTDPANSSLCISYPANFVPSAAFLKEFSIKKMKLAFTPDCRILEHPWHIFQYNDWAIRQDFEMLTAGRTGGEIPSTNHLIASGSVFAEPGASVSFSVLNAEDGPIYIGKNAEIQEGCLLRGPLAIGEGSRVKMGTRIYGATTIGPYCLAGGEIKNSVMMGFSNKAHDGYLGDSVLGEWCNLGAGTSNSNLKNTASRVKVWSKKEMQFLDAGEKCGLLMGDFSRCAINTSFTTGTVVGVSCHIFGNSFPSRFIDNFTWGNEKYFLEKAIRDISNWKRLKGQEISEQEIQKLKDIYQ
jgi:UDP-N-acetylglucosamine diphosphorylase/glucosamine-1-phosphate N-acetyltransferase